LVKFIHLPEKCTIRIFTLAGDQVTTLEHDDAVHGELQWNLEPERAGAGERSVHLYGRI